MKQKAKVLLLTSFNELDCYKAPILSIPEDNDKLVVNPKVIGDLMCELGTPKHLYFINNDEIDTNDAYYNNMLNKVFWNRGQLYDGANNKVIATTNPVLIDKGIDGIPESFIKKYIDKQGNIEEVIIDRTLVAFSSEHPNVVILDEEPKLFTREDVISLIDHFDSYRDFIKSQHESVRDWFNTKYPE